MRRLPYPHIRITLRCDNSGVQPENSGQYANNGGAPLKLGSHSKISGYDALNSGATRFKVRAPYCEIFVAHLRIFGKPKRVNVVVDITKTLQQANI